MKFDLEKSKVILQLIKCEVNRARREVINVESSIASLKVHKSYRDKENEENYGGGFDQNPYDSSLDFKIKEKQKSQEYLDKIESIYDYATDTFLENKS